MNTWNSLDGLDRRLVKALAKLGFMGPTECQTKAIPIALLGRDIMLKSRTGSGKTCAFALPVLQKILTYRDANPNSLPHIKSVILVPTKELCKQIEDVLFDLIYYCKDAVSIGAIDDARIKRKSFDTKPDIMIATPKSLLQLLDSHAVDLTQVKCVVIDEADLVLSFGYDADMLSIASKMPKIYQGIIVSATLSNELGKLRRKMLHNPVVLDIKEAKLKNERMQQYYLETCEKDKYLVLFVFLKLGLLKGKGLIFVNDVDKCFRIKLFLQQFYLTSAVVNAEVPINSRINIIKEFNQGVFDYLIATDSSFNQNHDEEENEENEKEEGEKHEKDEDREDEDEDEMLEEDGDGDVNEEKEDEAEAKAAPHKKKDKPEFDVGVSRGIDFVDTSFVLNFDFPTSAQSYEHRIGRTARSGAFGTALSFILNEDKQTLVSQQNIADLQYKERVLLQEVQQKQPKLINDNSNVLYALSATYDGGMAGATMPGGNVSSNMSQPNQLAINMKELDGFRYRVEDTLRSVTGAAVKEFRGAELKKEILNSEKLKDYFLQNPDDFKVLHHDKAISHPIRPKEHLKNVPNYLIPATMRGVVPVNTKTSKKKKGKGGGNVDRRLQSAKNNDPLSAASLLDTSTGLPVDNSVDGRAPMSMNESTSGRKKWQESHKRGKFNEKQKRKNAHLTPGTYTKAKKMK